MTQNIEEEKSSQKEKQETSKTSSNLLTEQELQLTSEGISEMVQRFQEKFSNWLDGLPKDHTWQKLRTKQTSVTQEN